VPEVADQGEQFRPAVTAGVGWWEVVDTAGLRPVERPAVSSSRRDRPDSVGDISHHTVPDPHGYDAQTYSVHASLVRDYLD
jgi:hypothetical protein